MMLLLVLYVILICVIDRHNRYTSAALIVFRKELFSQPRKLSYNSSFWKQNFNQRFPRASASTSLLLEDLEQLDILEKIHMAQELLKKIINNDWGYSCSFVFQWLYKWTGWSCDVWQYWNPYTGFSCFNHQSLWGLLATALWHETAIKLTPLLSVGWGTL